jgi:HNH endonuclease
MAELPLLALARLSVHHLLPASLGGTDDMANLLTLCHCCHPLYGKAARSLTLPVETPSARKRTRSAARVSTAYGFAGPAIGRGRATGSTTRGLMGNSRVLASTSYSARTG